MFRDLLVAPGDLVVPPTPSGTYTELAICSIELSAAMPGYVRAQVRRNKTDAVVLLEAAPPKLPGAVSATRREDAAR